MKLINIPVLPLRDIVVFPQMVAPLFVGRKFSINALNHVMESDKIILLITQKQYDVILFLFHVTYFLFILYSVLFHY